jgi:hypothetical protein
MNEYLRKHFGAKLFLSYLAIIGVGLLVLILASQFVLPAAFNQNESGWSPIRSRFVERYQLFKVLSFKAA